METHNSIFFEEYHTFVCPIIGAMIVESSSSASKNFLCPFLLKIPDIRVLRHLDSFVR